jgi:hypothetical protein
MSGETICMIIFVSILAALLGGGHVGSTTRREIKFVADYSFVDKKLWFTMPAIQGSCEPGNIWSNQSHDRATRNRFEIITCLVFRHVNSAHLSIKGIVAVDGVISDLDDNIGRRLASRVDKGDVETKPWSASNGRITWAPMGVSHAPTITRKTVAKAVQKSALPRYSARRPRRFISCWVSRCWRPAD